MTLKRILIASNYDDEMFDEEFLNVPAMDGSHASRVCASLNEVDPAGPNYYKVVDRDYTLYAFKP